VTESDRTAGGRAPLPPGIQAAVAVLILAPIVALLWVGSYAKATPRLWGFPFFYWYQFLWVFLAAGCTYTAHLLLDRARAAQPAGTPAAVDDGDDPDDGHAPEPEVVK
jgi:hypothetical protein